MAGKIPTAEALIADTIAVYTEYYGDRDLALRAAYADAVATGVETYIRIAAREARIIT